MSFESCSWLTNETPGNDARRRDLAALWVWLAAAGGVALWAGWRVPWTAGWRLAVRGGLLVAQAGVLLLLLTLLPKARAYGHWGFKYPAVTLEGKCEADLAGALRNGTCCAFDVTAGAEVITLLWRGESCPRAGQEINWGKGDKVEACRLTRKPSRIVVQGCG